MGLLLLATELKNKISCINTNAAYKPCHFGANRNLQKNLKVFPTVVAKREEPACDIKQLRNNEIISFYEETKENLHPFILLQAITLEMSEEDLNLERMEFIGDAFLQIFSYSRILLQTSPRK